MSVFLKNLVAEAMLKISIGIIVVAIIGIGVLIFLLKRKIEQIKKLKFEVKQKDLHIQKAAQNIKALTDYQRVTAEIRKNHRDLITEIENTKVGEDEKIDNIIHRVVTANNKLVQNRNTGSD